MDAGTAALIALDAKLQYQVDRIIESEDGWIADEDWEGESLYPEEGEGF